MVACNERVTSWLFAGLVLSCVPYSLGSPSPFDVLDWILKAMIKNSYSQIRQLTPPPPPRPTHLKMKMEERRTHTN